MSASPKNSRAKVKPVAPTPSRTPTELLRDALAAEDAHDWISASSAWEALLFIAARRAEMMASMHRELQLTRSRDVSTKAASVNTSGQQP